MILIADSGSTKTDWCLLGKDGYRKDIATKGMNPYQQSEEELCNEVVTALVPQLPEGELDAVYFYGAGCIYDKVPLMQRVLHGQLQIANHCEVNSDMLAVARGLCKHEAGIACILGTGSNSCFYNGQEITQNVSSLGFILGDEGSGSVMGKLFISDLFKNQLGEELKQEFQQQTGFDAGQIIENVYRKPYPNRFLASFAPFIKQHLDNPKVHLLVINNFLAFFRRNVMQYDYLNHSVHLCGSIAWHFKDTLQEAAEQIGIRIGSIEKSPLESLIAYHKAL